MSPADRAPTFTARRRAATARPGPVAVVPESPSQMIRDDLIGPEYSYNKDEEIILEKKEHMKARGLASPDHGDALALTFAEDVAPRAMPEYLQPEHYGKRKDYDRYAELEAQIRGGDDDYDRYKEVR